MVTIEEIRSKIEAIYEEAKQVYITDNCYAHIWPQAAIIGEQNSWPKGDGSKCIDFSIAPVWFMHGDPEVPLEPINSAEELFDHYVEGYVWGLNIENQDDLLDLSKHLDKIS